MFETEKLPPLKYVGMAGVTVKIHDLNRRIVVDIVFRRVGVSCRACDIDTCQHVKYALSVPDVQKVVYEWKKDGWDLPNMPDSILLVV
jgi:hypothetical protein